MALSSVRIFERLFLRNSPQLRHPGFSVGSDASGNSRGKLGLKIRDSANFESRHLRSCCNFSVPTTDRLVHFVRMRDDIQTRIENLKREIEEVSSEKPLFGTAPDCPPEVEEAFLRQVLSCELAEKKRRERRKR